MQTIPTGPARFCRTSQLLNWRGELDEEEVVHAARLFFAEAGFGGTNLKRFLSKVVLFGNCGTLSPPQIKLIARELFGNPHSEQMYLDPMRRDNCLGYSEEEVTTIKRLVSERAPNGEAIKLALGYEEPKRRRF